MTEPSEAAKRRAREILGGSCSNASRAVHCLALHLDAEGKAAQKFLELYMAYTRVSDVHEFAHRHILPESRPTVRDVLLKQLPGFDEACALIENALREAGLLKETDCE